MALAIFDLDNTLLAGDSDYLWGTFLVDQGEVDGEIYESTNQHFYDDYKTGQLDIFAFLKFSLEPLTRLTNKRLAELQEQFMREVIKPLVSTDALALVDKHRANSDTLLIITATNHFITAPIAKLFGIDHLLATEPEILNGRYTGSVAGTPCYQDGKVIRLKTWLAEHDQNLNNSWFYSDSHNDLPLLLLVEHPIVVNPDDILRQHAKDNNWKILHLHNGT
ncbi:Phosphoserine phosphatase [hydrothermal vent metagenome]|uniref:Phosphoserine phosphatase n=1 Tax=hydrothermal vent metagenome TaxID=652676 RepID=A0A3B0ZPU9_9ZZZZ